MDAEKAIDQHSDDVVVQPEPEEKVIPDNQINLNGNSTSWKLME